MTTPVIYFQDTFLRGTTAVNAAAGSTSGVGNGWIDRVGGVYALKNNAVNALAVSGNQYLTYWLIRPASEASTTQRIRFSFSPLGGTGTPIALLRVNSANDTAYACFFDGSASGTSTLHIATFINGVNTSLSTMGGVAFNNIHSYIIDFQATPNASSGTDLVANAYDAANPGTSIATVTVTGDTTSSLQAAGTYAISYANTLPSATSVTLYNGATSAQLAVGPANAAQIPASGIVPIKAFLSNSSAALAVSVSGGGSLSTTAPVSGTAFNWTAPASGAGTATVTVTDATDSLTQTSTIAYTGLGMAASPASVPLGQVTALTLQGIGTSWTSSTMPTISGGSSAVLSNMAINTTTQTMSCTIWPGASAATLTIGDSTDSVSTTIAAVANVTNNAVWHGDSLTYGQNGSNPGTAGATRLAVTLSGMGPAWSCGGNFGVQGQTLVQMLGQVSTQITPAFVAGKTNWLFAQGGHNDINQGKTIAANAPALAATVIANIQAYVAAVLAGNPNWRIIWSTEPPAAYPGYPAWFDGTRDMVNTWLRANWKSIGIYALCDFALDQVMGQDGQEYNTTYYSSTDHTHPYDAGYAVWGRYELATVQNSYFGKMGAGTVYTYS